MTKVRLSREEQGLIERLEYDRDYGASRTRHDVVKDIQDGTIKIYEGTTFPVLKDAVTGKIVKGSGRMPSEVQSVRGRSGWTERFRDLGRDHFDEMFERLLDRCRVGDFKALEFYFNKMAGKPSENKDLSDTGKNSMMDMYAAKLAAGIPEEIAAYVPPKPIRIADRNGDKYQTVDADGNTVEKTEYELSPEEVAVLIDAGEYHNPDQRMAQALTSQIYGGTTHIHVEEYTEDEQKRLMSLFDDMEDEIEERKQLTSREEADDLIQQGIEHARAIQEAQEEPEEVLEELEEELEEESELDARTLGNAALLINLAQQGRTSKKRPHIW